jgi:hypothetical protein
MHTCMCMHACLSLFFSFGENTVVFMLRMCMTVSGFCLSTIISMHDRGTHAEITRTPLNCGGDECDADLLSLLIQSYIQTCILLCGCMDV